MRVGHAGLTLLCLAGVTISIGCEAISETGSEGFLEVSTPADGPDRLLEQIQQKQLAIRETGELYAKAGGEFRLRMMRMHAQSGMDLADQILKHSDATDDQRSQACQEKLNLLRQGVQLEFTDFDDQLEAYVDQIRTELPQSPEAELADAVLLERSISRGVDFDEMMSALEEHAKTYPDGRRAIAVFKNYAEHLINLNHIPQAMRCCENGLQRYSQYPESTSLQLLLSNMRKYVAAEESKRVAKKARLARIARQLGYREQGYFLIYAHENKSMGMIEVEYHIARGAAAVATYVDTLKPDWVWKVHRWFPDTKNGELEAELELNECLKGTTRSFY